MCTVENGSEIDTVRPGIVEGLGPYGVLAVFLVETGGTMRPIHVTRAYVEEVETQVVGHNRHASFVASV